MTEVAITSRAREVREIELGEGSAPHAVIGQLLEHLDRYLAADTAASGDALKRGEPMPFLERVNEAPAASRSGSRASSAALRRRARSRRGVVVVAARELDKHARLIPHAPGVVASGSIITSLVENSSSLPSSMTTCSLPDRTTATCGSPQLFVPA